MGPASLAASRPRAAGFALIVTIVLVAFLVLILVGLATFTRVETQVATNTQAQSQARQNALFALNLALGQLQQHTGPDQRVTAPADLRPLAPGASVDPVSGVSLAGASTTALAASDTWWNDRRNRHWVGAWRDPDPARSSFDPANPAESNPVPELLGWLVSGNEAAPDDHVPETRLPTLDLAALADPANPVLDSSSRPHRILVGANGAAITDAAQLHRTVTAPQVELRASQVPGFAVDDSRLIGHYAWWVGDEGGKARIDLIDPYAGSTDDDERLHRFQVAQRPAITSISPALATGFPADAPLLRSVLAFEQLGFVTSAAVHQDELRPRFHDLTLHSRGVLADVRNGGLRADLSWLFGQASDSDALADLRDLYSAPSLALGDPIISPSITPYATPPPTFNADQAMLFRRSTTWAQLRSHFALANAPDAARPGVFLGSATALARRQTQMQVGVSPVLVQAKLFFGLRVNADRSIDLLVRPLFVLANPYPVTLTGTWHARYASPPGVDLRVGDFSTTPPPDHPSVADATAPVGVLSEVLGGSSITYGPRLVNLRLSDVALAPGEARVFTLADNVTTGISGPAPMIELTEGLNELSAISIQTGRSLPADRTHVALRAGGDRLAARLYAADPATNVGGADDNLHQYVIGKNYASAPATVPDEDRNPAFFVYPLESGERLGGGLWFNQLDAFEPAQQSIFSQYNFRTPTVVWAGASSANGHPLERALTHGRNGAPGNEDWFKADLLFDPDLEKVRWGPVVNGRRPSYTVAPAGVGAQTGFRNVLYDLPRPGRPVASLGQLQHLNPSGYVFNGQHGGTSADSASTSANVFQNNYPIANSYPNLRVERDRLMSASGVRGTIHDSSWLLNEVLFDRFLVSGLPASGSFDLATGSRANPRLRPFRDPVAFPASAPATFRGSPRRAAANLLSEGAFNINSTSVAAWRAQLGSLRRVPVAGDTSPENPFSRTLSPSSGYTGSRTANTPASWTGHHDLSDGELDDLARDLVLQIRRRGPFLSLASFVNRRLVPAASDPLDLGRAGALQAAINTRLNRATDLDAIFQTQSRASSTTSGVTTIAENAFRMPSVISGFPGHVLQGDLLSSLAPALSARSDTFRIRSYGDVVNPADPSTVLARAWLEAMVQRLPDHVDPTDGPEARPAAGSVNERFGRRYQIVSFRWLSPADL